MPESLKVVILLRQEPRALAFRTSTRTPGQILQGLTIKMPPAHTTCQKCGQCMEQLKRGKSAASNNPPRMVSVLCELEPGFPLR